MRMIFRGVIDVDYDRRINKYIRDKENKWGWNLKF